MISDPLIHEMLCSLENNISLVGNALTHIDSPTLERTMSEIGIVEMAPLVPEAILRARTHK